MNLTQRADVTPALFSEVTMRRLWPVLALVALTLSCADQEEPVTTAEQALTEPSEDVPAGQQDVPVEGSEPPDTSIVNHGPAPSIRVRQDVIDAQNRYLEEAARLRAQWASDGLTAEVIETKTAELKRSIMGD